MTDDRAELEDPDTELVIDGPAGQPTAEERAEVERRWNAGEMLPPPWIVVDLSGQISNVTGRPIPAGTFAMLKAPKIWAERFAEEMNQTGASSRSRTRDPGWWPPE